MLPTWGSNITANPLFFKIMEALRAAWGPDARLQEPTIGGRPSVINQPIATIPSRQDAEFLLQSPPVAPIPPGRQGGLPIGAGTIAGPSQGMGSMEFKGDGWAMGGYGDGRLAGLMSAIKGQSGPMQVQNNRGTYDPVRNAQLAALDQLQNVMLGVGQPSFRVESELASTPAPWLEGEYRNKQAQGLIGLIGALSQSQAPEAEAQARIQAAVAEAGERAAAERYKADTAAGAKIQEQQLAGQSELDQIKMQGILEAIKQAIGTNTDPKEAMRMVLMLLKGLGGGGGMDQLVSGLAGGGSQGPQ